MFSNRGRPGAVRDWMFEIGCHVAYLGLLYACFVKQNLTGLAVLFACSLAYLGYKGLPLKIVQQQLRNLYMLLAFGVDKIDTRFPLSSDPTKTLTVNEAGHAQLLEQWEQHVFQHYLGCGLAPEEAFGAYLDTTHSYAKFIAELASERIKNACNGTTLDMPCEACAKAILEANQSFQEVLAEEKRRKAVLSPLEYMIFTPPCPEKKKPAR